MKVAGRTERSGGEEAAVRCGVEGENLKEQLGCFENLETGEAGSSTTGEERSFHEMMRPTTRFAARRVIFFDPSTPAQRSQSRSLHT